MICTACQAIRDTLTHYDHRRLCERCLEQFRAVDAKENDDD